MLRRALIGKDLLCCFCAGRADGLCCACGIWLDDDNMLVCAHTKQNKNTTTKNKSPASNTVRRRIRDPNRHKITRRVDPEKKHIFSIGNHGLRRGCGVGRIYRAKKAQGQTDDLSTSYIILVSVYEYVSTTDIVGISVVFYTVSS